MKVLALKIHGSKVLTDHFSNSFPEKTTNDIPMKFSQCPFKTIFYRLQLSNLIYLQIIHERRNVILRFTACASRALTISHFKLDISHDSEPPHQKKKENIARFVTRLCSTLF